jgi:DNA-binding NarL/FixJ family response regulator
MAAAENRPLRLLLVDDHEVVRAGLRLLLTRAGFEIAGEAGTAAEAVSIAAQIEPDVVVMDVRLPDGSGVEACREIRSARPGTRVLFLTAFEDEDAMLAAVFSSADGYLLKEVNGDKLVQAVRTVAHGLSVLNPGLTRPFVERLRRLSEAGPRDGGDALSAQERRVLALVAKGKTNKEIGAALKLSPKTVKNYLSHVFQKLQVTRRSEAAARFVRDAE